MRFTVRREDSVAILDLDGDLVADSADETISHAVQAAAEHKYVVLDLQNVGFMDSSGLRSCRVVHTMLAEKGGLAAFANPNKNVDRLFRMTKAHQRLIITHSISAALGKLKFAMPGGGVNEENDGSGNVVQLRLGRDFGDISGARAAIREYCERRFPEPEHRTALDDFYLATAEAMNNSVEHSGAQSVGVAVGAAGNVIIFKLVTPGPRFDPTVKHPMPDLDADELPEGGFGLAIIQELTDSLEYEYLGGKNILTLKKYVFGIEKEEQHGN